MIPNYDFNKIKFATDRSTFEKAAALYDGGKVLDFKKDARGFSARVQGGQIYHVSVSAKNFDVGSCDCYLGQNDYLCKHMVAVAIYAVLGGEKIKAEDIEPVGEVKCSGRLGELLKDELAEVKKSISSAMKYIKSYEGPSRIWFAYQNSLSEGCNRLSVIVSNLPVSAQTAELLIKTLLKLDKKLCESGVDDSDGTVGGFIQECVEALKEFVRLDRKCVNSFKLLRGQSTCFGWEEPLARIFDERGRGQSTSPIVHRNLC
jgi:hypothetical protein